jgi:hypothetical protein
MDVDTAIPVQGHHSDAVYLYTTPILIAQPCRQPILAFKIDMLYLLSDRHCFFLIDLECTTRVARWFVFKPKIPIW